MEKIITAIAIKKQVEEYHSFVIDGVDKDLAYGELVRLVARMDEVDLDAMEISFYDENPIAEKYRQEANALIKRG